MEIIYPVGKHIGIRNLLTQKMRFIKTSDSVRELSQIHVSGDKRHLAVAEKKKNDKSVYLYVIDLKSSAFKMTSRGKINLFQTGDDAPPLTSEKYVVDLSFSHDSKYLVALTKPDLTIKIFTNNNAFKQVAHYDLASELKGKVEINKIRFNSIDPSYKLVVAGKNFLKNYSIAFNDDSLKPAGEFSGYPKKDCHFTYIGWTYEGYMIAGTAKGEVFVFKEAEQVEYFQYHRPDSSFEDETAVTLIRIFEFGFVVGYMNGTVTFYRHKLHTEEFGHVKTWFCKPFAEDRIISLSI
jgi:hypothetical protein